MCSEMLSLLSSYQHVLFGSSMSYPLGKNSELKFSSSFVLVVLLMRYSWA